MYGFEDTEDTLPCAKCDGTGTQYRNTGIDQPKQLVQCPDCKGEGLVFAQARKTNSIPCPKDQAFKDLLDECSEKGRMVSYGSFNGSIDRMVEIGVSLGWMVIRVDGRGWHYFGCHYKSDADALAAFASGDGNILFTGHPKSGGMGFSLSAADTIVYWDNTFAAEDRLQSVERGTDAGMDLNKGCRIIDLIHLPVDELVLDKLDKKENLQAITMGELRRNEYGSHIYEIPVEQIEVDYNFNTRQFDQMDLGGLIAAIKARGQEEAGKVMHQPNHPTTHSNSLQASVGSRPLATQTLRPIGLSWLLSAHWLIS